MGIANFEKKNRMLALKVFSDGNLEQLDSEEEKFLNIFVTSGTFGTKSRGIKNRVNMVEKVGKIRYILMRVFMPMTTVKANYPFFYKHKFLLPLLPFYRLFRGWKSAVMEIRLLRKR